MSARDERVLDVSDGELRVYTDVEGRAARMGHRLTLPAHPARGPPPRTSAC